MAVASIARREARKRDAVASIGETQVVSADPEFVFDGDAPIDPPKCWSRSCCRLRVSLSLVASPPPARHSWRLRLGSLGQWETVFQIPSEGKSWCSLRCRGGCSEFWRSGYRREACGGDQRTNPICLDTHSSALADATGAHRVHSQASRL